MTCLSIYRKIHLVLQLLYFEYVFGLVFRNFRLRFFASLLSLANCGLLLTSKSLASLIYLSYHACCENMADAFLIKFYYFAFMMGKQSALNFNTDFVNLHFSTCHSFGNPKPVLRLLVF